MGHMITLQEQIRSYRPICQQEACDQALMLGYLARFPDDILTRENTLCHFTASAWITNERFDRVLMVYHNIYRSWSWTGGHADGDAALSRVALREAGEETGVSSPVLLLEEPISLEILTVEPHVRRGAFVSAHLHLNLTYLLQASRGEHLHANPDENSGVCWMSPEDAVARSREEMMKPIYGKLNRRLAAFAGQPK